jgi:hypothetical protein
MRGRKQMRDSYSIDFNSGLGSVQASKGNGGSF